MEFNARKETFKSQLLGMIVLFFEDHLIFINTYILINYTYPRYIQKGKYSRGYPL